MTAGAISQPRGGQRPGGSRPTWLSVSLRWPFGYRARHSVRPSSPNPRGANVRHLLVPVMLVLLGVGVLVYPVVATQYNNVKQREFAQAYQHQVAAIEPATLSAQLESARAYNSTLTGVPILDPWLTKVSGTPNSGPYTEYLGQLSALDAMARVRVPSIGVDLPVYHGTSDEVIARGLGHLYGTSLPVGGEGTHTVLTSHTGMSNATLLDHLIDLKEGDHFFFDVAGETLAYEVDQIKVVLPTEIKDLVAEPGKDQATLFTCTPYAVNSHRLLVRGHRVPFEGAVAAQAQEQAAPTFVMETWMYWLLGAAAASLLMLIAAIVAAKRRRRGRHRARRTPLAT